MGTCIESVVTTSSSSSIFRRGSLHLAEAAARACLERAARRPDELDLLVNTGVYKEKNMAEPALAAIIQEDIHANPGHPPRHGHHGTFSFDVSNGGCGCLTATHLADSFLRDGRIRLAMVVTADADPSPRSSRGFPFRPVAGALLLAHTSEPVGFVGHEFRTFPEFADLFVSRLDWDPAYHRMLGGHGGNVVEVREDPSFAARGIECAVNVAQSFLATAGLRPADIHLLVASQYPADFANSVAQALGVGSDLVAHARPQCRMAHTAGPMAALEAAAAARTFDEATNVLFVTLGAGITIAVALYRKRGRSPLCLSTSA